MEGGTQGTCRGRHREPVEEDFHSDSLGVAAYCLDDLEWP